MTFQTSEQTEMKQNNTCTIIHNTNLYS